MQIILIGNYKPDKQESMERFAQMLSTEFSANGVTPAIWRPPALLGSFFSATNRGAGKWMAYIDKWIIFPVILHCRVKFRFHKKKCSYHICDHSNAPYLKCLPAGKSVITCHDVLAIMGALGYRDTFCEASRMGKLLQKWILKHLGTAQKLAAVSEQTLKQLYILLPGKDKAGHNWQVIYNGFNNDFRPLQHLPENNVLTGLGLQSQTPYLLHVGSGLPRKNRKLLIDMAIMLESRWDGKICYAGEKIEPALLQYAEERGIKDKIINIVRPSHEILTLLYSGCAAFVFPSYSEGFGWPLIEAQACGVPVIASNVQPMPEISGGAALHCDPDRPQDFTEGFMWLQEKKNKEEIVARGFVNISRFTTKKMTNAYLLLHGIKI
jgi:glycosyltransferase involved in cell wall biosynthesis